MSERVLAVVGRGVLDVETPILRGDDLGFTRGEGVFETMRVGNGHAFLFSEHLRRMRAGASRLGLKLPAAGEWTTVVEEALAAFGDETGLLRMYTTRGPDSLPAPISYLLVGPIPEATSRSGREGTHAVTLSLGIAADARSVAPWLLGGVKTTSYAVAMAGKREAEGRGATDAIWISSDGEVLEEATSSVVWVRDGAAYTIPAVTGILTGTTLACVRAGAATTGIEIADRRSSLADLRNAEELLLLSAVRGVAAVLTLDGRPVGDGAQGAVGRSLRNCFEQTFAAAIGR